MLTKDINFVKNLVNMDKLNFVGIIPARYASSRFPGKPLALLGDKSMIERVWNQVNKVIDEVYVATDDERIYTAVEAFGGKAIMTSVDHKSGTDRCYEAYINSKSSADVIINIQGDEPFIHVEQIKEIMKCFNDESTQIATLARPVDANSDFKQLEDWTKPKVILDKYSNALYFSRSIIPYVRNEEKENWAKSHQFYKHVGMYAYKAKVLAEITKLPQSSLEVAESLEQLRWLQNGYKIKVGMTNQETIGIDTPEDLERALEFLKNNR